VGGPHLSSHSAGGQPPTLSCLHEGFPAPSVRMGARRNSAPRSRAWELGESSPVVAPIGARWRSGGHAHGGGGGSYPAATLVGAGSALSRRPHGDLPNPASLEARGSGEQRRRGEEIEGEGSGLKTRADKRGPHVRSG
jgi:hypothetical protein